MKTSQASAAIDICIRANLPVLLVGTPGVGKTAIVEQAARAQDADLIVSYPALGDPTDVKGLPWVSKSKTEATFLPFGDLAEALKAKKKTVWFLDDLGQATQAVQASWMQLLLARQVNGRKIPDCVTFVAATNRRQDRAGVSGILEPVKSRFATILHIEPDLNDWTLWAYTAAVPPEVINFLRFRHELFHKFEPTADMVNSPSPRTWQRVGELFKANVPEDLELEVYGGAVGEGAAREFVGFLKLYRHLPNIDAVLLDPEQAEIPKEISVRYALCAGLANKVTNQNFSRIAKYATRLYDAGEGDYAALLVKDCVRKDPSVKQTAAFTKLAASPLGQLWAA